MSAIEIKLNKNVFDTGRITWAVYLIILLNDTALEGIFYSKEIFKVGNSARTQKQAYMCWPDTL